MISQVDDALRTLVRQGARDAGVEVVFDAPTKGWAARRNAPTVNLYLYDIREDIRRRERGWLEDRNDDGVVLARRPVPRYFKLSYLVTAWTQRPEDEHRLLDTLLRSFLLYEALPDAVVTGELAETGLPVPLSVGMPPPEDRAFADVWSALGGELKPSLDVVVTAPISTGVVYELAKTASEGAVVDLSDTRGGAVDHGRRQHIPPSATVRTPRRRT